MSNMKDFDRALVAAPAPVFYIATSLIGFAINSNWPVAIATNAVIKLIGILLISISIPLVIFTVLAMRSAKTAFDARRSTTIIVTDGPFRYSRNPTYLSLTLLTAGVSLVLNSVWLLAGAAIATGLTQWLVINPEERYLMTKFGDEYDQYTSRVRRWI